MKMICDIHIMQSCRPDVNQVRWKVPFEPRIGSNLERGGGGEGSNLERREGRDLERGGGGIILTGEGGETWRGEGGVSWRRKGEE